MDDPAAVAKKLEELRKHIPLIDSNINRIQGNPQFQSQYNKLIKLKEVLTTGRFVSIDKCNKP